MNWLNIHAEVVRGPLMAAAPSASVGTWMRVASYCVLMENGGRIPGADAWPDRMWMISCGVTRKEVRAAHPLMEFASGDLLIAHYPQTHENAAKAGREGGKSGGRPKRTHNPKDNPTDNPPDNPPDNLGGTPNVKKGKVKEEEGKGIAPARGAESSISAGPEALRSFQAPCTLEESTRYAASLPVAPVWSPAMVLFWWNERAGNGWRKANDRPITPDTWRHDLQNAHQWAQQGNSTLPGLDSSQKKKEGAPPDVQAAVFAIIRARFPDFRGTFSDIPVGERRAALAEIDRKKKEGATA